MRSLVVRSSLYHKQTLLPYVSYYALSWYYHRCTAYQTLLPYCIVLRSFVVLTALYRTVLQPLGLRRA